MVKSDYDKNLLNPTKQRFRRNPVRLIKIRMLTIGDESGMYENLVFTNDKCIGCNKCIRACESTGACIAVEKDGRARIDVDPVRCIACGGCETRCPFGVKIVEKMVAAVEIFK